MPRFSYGLCLSFLCLVWTPISHGQVSTKLADIFGAQQKRLNEFKDGVEFHCVVEKQRNYDRSKLKNSPRYEAIATVPQYERKEVTFRSKGEKHRTDWVRYTKDGVVFDHQSDRYDGDQYAIINVEGRFARSYRGRREGLSKYGLELPILAPYGFAFLPERTPSSLERLTDPDLWKTFLESSRVVGVESIDGIETVVVQTKLPNFELKGKPIATLIYFANELDFYPLRYEFSVDGNVFYRCTASDVEQVPNGVEDRTYIHGQSVLETFAPVVSGKAGPKTNVLNDLKKFSLSPVVDDDVFKIKPGEIMDFVDTENSANNFMLSNRAPFSGLLDDTNGAPEDNAKAVSVVAPSLAQSQKSDIILENSSSSLSFLPLIFAFGCLALGAGVVFFKKRKR